MPAADLENGMDSPPLPPPPPKEIRESAVLVFFLGQCMAVRCLIIVAEIKARRGGGSGGLRLDVGFY